MANTQRAYVLTLWMLWLLNTVAVALLITNTIYYYRLFATSTDQNAKNDAYNLGVTNTFFAAVLFVLWLAELALAIKNTRNWMSGASEAEESEEEESFALARPAAQQLQLRLRHGLDRR